MEIVSTAKSPGIRVLVIHSWWGLTKSFRDYAHLLAETGFTVGLSDLYDGRTATDETQVKRLRQMPRKIPIYKMLSADIRRLQEFGGRHAPSVNLVGFSMGGHWAVWLSQQAGLPVRSATLYYAVRAGDFSSSKASFLAHFAEHDPWVRKSARARMEREIERARCAYESFDYPGTGHWFAETARTSEYDATASSLAMKRTVAHIRAA